MAKPSKEIVMNQLIPVDQTIVLAWGAGLFSGTTASGIEAALSGVLTRRRIKENSSWSAIIARKAPSYAAIYAVAAGGYTLVQMSDPSITLSTSNQINLKIWLLMSVLVPICNSVLDQVEERFF